MLKETAKLHAYVPSLFPHKASGIWSERSAYSRDHVESARLLLLSPDHAIQAHQKVPEVIINRMLERNIHTKNSYDFTPSLWSLGQRMRGVM